MVQLCLPFSVSDAVQSFLFLDYTTCVFWTEIFVFKLVSYRQFKSFLVVLTLTFIENKKTIIIINDNNNHDNNNYDNNNHDNNNHDNNNNDDDCNDNDNENDHQQPDQ